MVVLTETGARSRCGCLPSIHGSTGACAHLDPPMRATPVQAGEREMESPTSNIVQVPQGGMSPDLCTVSFDDRPPLSQTFAQVRLTLAVKTGRSSLGG